MRGGVRQKVRLRKYKPALPTITMSNVRSIGNKIDEIREKVRYDNDFRISGLLCLTETWLNSATPTQAFGIPDFDMIRSDRVIAKTNKSKGGGLAMYVNSKWCRNYKVRSEICNATRLTLFCQITPEMPGLSDLAKQRIFTKKMIPRLDDPKTAAKKK